MTPEEMDKADATLAKTAMAAFDIKMAEIGDKLNGLIAVVEGWRHEPPNRPQ